MKKLKQQIKENYSELTQGLKSVANFIVANSNSVALYPAKEIGNLTNTSETTVIRCCHALGYSGYAALQEEIRNSLLQPDNDPFKALTDGMKNESPDIQASVEQDIEFMRKTFDSMDKDHFNEAIDKIIDSKKVLIVGLRTSYAAANWLSYSLNIVKGDTYLFKGDIDDAHHLLTLIDEDWLVIALSFRRYSQQTISFVSATKEQGAQIVTITDDELSPLGLMSDITLNVITPNPSSLKGMPTIFSILNAMVSGVMIKNSQEVEKRLEEYQRTSDVYPTFYNQRE
ncbi:MurR/RpiR family transcriptional regulator [Chryseomicrobium aureum]|uniref:MurR/RpiR family transcriptional regulator n=1 Tax=Chryseomicrobium aureum TaxID=1441723 RepID=UPI00195EBA29|nr:MurR/RpiR family transcriptional regulator [Chryseomicrobium aureum]MBM7707079.1 DNA-binding MurR/RpiR family transcriptional regulator [Chryseomicrobium aureum]